MKVYAHIDYTSMYESRIREVYDQVDPEALASYISEEDIRHPEKVADVIGQWTNTCYIFCGYLASLLDYYSIAYKCYLGVAIGKASKQMTTSQVANIQQPNHAWIECNNKYYELFVNQDDIQHLKIIKEVNL